jgi:DNA-binding NarL/FixJ family response regulator
MSGDPSLPPRAHHVSELREQGRSRAEIAEGLGISKRTVESHLRLVDKTSQTVPALTPRQLQIAALLARGRSAPDIAQQIGLALPTVKLHRRLIFATLDIHTVVELTHNAILQGWVRLGQPLARTVRKRFRSHTLSARQRQVGELLAQGRNQRQIAEHLGISQGAVRQYRQRLRAVAPPGTWREIEDRKARPTKGASRRTWASLLSPPERRVADLLAATCTPQQVAERLAIELTTVRRYLHQMRRRLDALSEEPPRELRVAIGLAKGQSMHRSAQQLGIHPASVIRGHRLLMATLGLRNEVELTHYAILHGWVALGEALAPQVRERAGRRYRHKPDPLDLRTRPAKEERRTEARLSFEAIYLVVAAIYPFVKVVGP